MKKDKGEFKDDKKLWMNEWGHREWYNPNTGQRAMRSYWWKDSVIFLKSYTDRLVTGTLKFTDFAKELSGPPYEWVPVLPAAEAKKRTEKFRETLLKHETREMEQFAKKYPDDIGLLYESYKTLARQRQKASTEQKKLWGTEDKLQGYLSCISDLIIIKKGHWGDR